MLKKFDPINRDYFMRKWGVIGDKNPVFKTPFNIAIPISFWSIQEPRMEEMRKIWNEFFNNETVSIY